jgi:hypothetical protein
VPKADAYHAYGMDAMGISAKMLRYNNL